MKAAWCILIAAFAFGCDAESDMGQQPKYKPLSPSSQFDDGKSARPLVAGVVPRDATTVPGNAYATTATTQPADDRAAVKDDTPNPRSITADLIARGQQQFDVFCAACHGRLGNGMGMVAERGLMHPPSFHVDRLKRVGDGHFYNVMTNGYGAMYSYSDKISADDRWAIVAYVRALQLGGNTAAGDVAAILHGAGDANAKTAGYRQ